MKQLDDKLLLIEIHITDCRANFACANIPKAKAAMTAAKTNGKKKNSQKIPTKKITFSKNLKLNFQITQTKISLNFSDCRT